MDNSIWPAIIGVFGDVLSACITVVGGVLISNRFIAKNVNTYIDDGYDAGHIMNRAKDSIFIVSEIGDELWKKHKNDFIRYLDMGVDIYWLISSEKYFTQINNYIESDVTCNKRNSVIKEMLEVQSLDKNGRFILQTFNGFITSSFIAVDIDMEDIEGLWRKSSVIHYMPYCYKVNASKSPIQNIYANKNKEVFKALALSIKKMWQDGTPVESIKQNHQDYKFSMSCKIRQTRPVRLKGKRSVDEL